MKTIIRKSATAAALLLTLAASSLSAQAKSSCPVYKRSLNSKIGVSVENATGAKYKIRNSKGEVVLEGQVKDSGKFYIPTGALAKGVYHFMIGNMVWQEFVIS